MPVPYTREAIAQLRAAARNSTPHAAIIAQFGWSPGMLDRVCRDHGINISPPANASSIAPPANASSSLTHTAVVPLLPAEQLTQFIEKLPPRQKNAMTVLRAANILCDGFIPASAISGRDASEAATRAVGRVIAMVGVRLSDRRIPYRIERKANDGYRLLFTGAKS